MFGDYYQVRDWLEGFIPQTYTAKNLGLERIKYLLKLLDNPQDKFKSIHIAGTSGKGSTAYYTARLLAENFKLKKIGLHLSPHLVDLRERMQIFESLKFKVQPVLDRVETRSGSSKFKDGLMPMKRFIKLFNEIYPIVEKIKKDKFELTPSYFEILVAASFKYFAEEKVDFAVVEVGLGGRLDATNVLRPKLCVITNVGLDHTEILGDSIEKIAYEKAGIIKEKVPVITAALRLRSGSSTTEKALKVIEKVAKSKKAPLIKIDTQNPPKSLKSDTKDYLVKYYDMVRHIPQNFALENVLLAISALEALGFRVSKLSLKQVLSLSFSGRFEQIDDRVIIDGAHNPQKIKFLINFLRKFTVYSSQFTVILVVAFKKGKEWQKMLDLLVKNLPVKMVIATKFYAVTDMGRYQAVDPKEIKDYLDTKYKIQDTRYFNNSQEAVFLALAARRSASNQLILVTGSLYLVGEVRTVWKLPEFDN